MHNTDENMFGKMRGRFSGADARCAVNTLIETALNNLWALSDADLERLIAEHNARNASKTHKLRMHLTG